MNVIPFNQRPLHERQKVYYKYLIDLKNHKAMKFYRVKQDNPVWKQGAIIKEESGGYVGISDLWNVSEHEDADTQYGSYTVENSPDWFERVYELSMLGKTKYVLKEAAMKRHEEMFEGK